MRVAAGRPAGLRFFVDEVRSVRATSTTLPAACWRSAASMSTGPLHVAGPEGWSRYDFARQVCRVHGVDPDAVRAGSLADLPGARPGRVVLDSGVALALGLPTPGAVGDRLSAP